MNKQKLIIDVDIVIALYNEMFPDKLPMTRKRLAKILGVNAQVFSDWKSGKKTPKWAFVVFELMFIGKCGAKEFIIKKDD